MIIFDIETGPDTDERLALVRPEFQADKRLKDPAKIAQDLEDKEAEWKEKAALSPLTGQILAIGFFEPGTSTGIGILHGEERTILEDFWILWRTSERFVGFAIKHYDVPFIVMRSRILQVAVPLDVMEGRYLSHRWVDLQEVWCLNQYDTKGHSLDAVCRACGLGKKNGNGADFARLWREDKPKAVEYLHNDISITLALAKRLGVT